MLSVQKHHLTFFFALFYTYEVAVQKKKSKIADEASMKNL